MGLAMANSENGTATALVEHAATISHLQCVTNPDGSFKFQFKKLVVINSRKYGLFVLHPELYDEVKRFDRKMKANSKALKFLVRSGPSFQPSALG